jgi:hypothetical protein
MAAENKREPAGDQSPSGEETLGDRELNEMELDKVSGGLYAAQPPNRMRRMVPRSDPGSIILVP